LIICDWFEVPIGPIDTSKVAKLLKIRFESNAMAHTNVTSFGVAVGATVWAVKVVVEDRKPTYFRDHATPHKCLPLLLSPTPRPPIRRIARPPTPQLSSSFDSRATHARTHQPTALASVPFGFVIARVFFEDRN
jgi:hypothetical protein